MSIHHSVPKAVLTDENKLYVFIFTNNSMAIILSLSTSIRGNFLFCTGYFLLIHRNERIENAKKRE